MQDNNFSILYGWSLWLFTRCQFGIFTQNREFQRKRDFQSKPNGEAIGGKKGYTHCSPIFLKRYVTFRCFCYYSVILAGDSINKKKRLARGS